MLLLLVIFYKCNCVKTTCPCAGVQTVAGHSDTAALAAPDVLGEEAPPEAAHGRGPARAPGRGWLQSPPLCGHSRPASGCGRLPPVQVTPAQYSR